MNMRKIGIVGAGHVGSHVANALCMQGIADEIILMDIDEQKAISQALDCVDCNAFLPHHVVVRPGKALDMQDCDIIVISVGIIAASGDRLDELQVSIDMIQSFLPDIMQGGFHGIFVVITNPVDIITACVQKISNTPFHQVIGTGTGLDSSRLRRILAQKTNVSEQSIQAYCMGEHGNSQMVPWSAVSIMNKPLMNLIREFPKTYGALDLEDIVAQTAKAGWDVYAGKGATEFAIALTCCQLINAIYHDEKKIIPCSAQLHGEYGQQGIYASVPACIGKHGVEYILTLPLSKEEQLRFQQTCTVIRNTQLSSHLF